MDLFDIIGPVMIGPSSSHTAGAARIGKVTLSLLSEKCVDAHMALHGSFSKTARGHGTDRALVGGLLGMEVDDPRIRDSLEIAKTEGLSVRFSAINLRNAHPNTVVITAKGESGKVITVRSSSIGGGNIVIDEVNGLLLGMSCDNDTLVIQHHDATGVIAGITGTLSKANINIASMRDFRSAQGGDALMALEIDSPVDSNILKSLQAVDAIISVTFLERRAL